MEVNITPETKAAKANIILGNPQKKSNPETVIPRNIGKTTERTTMQQKKKITIPQGGTLGTPQVATKITATRNTYWKHPVVAYQ